MKEQTHEGQWSRHLSRWTLYLATILLVVLALAITVLRVTLPALAQNKAQLEQFLTKRTEHPIHIGELETYWAGWYPGLRIRDLEIFSPIDLTRAIRLDEIRVSLALLPLLWGELRVDSLVLVKPSLGLERLGDGRFQITGFGAVRTKQSAGNGNFMLWLLKQNRVVVEDGEFQWFDHNNPQRAAVYVSKINLSLENAGERHQLGVKVQLPPEICVECSMIVDIRGDPFTARSWGGGIFVKMVDMNLDALPAVVKAALPLRLGGKLNVQLWTTWKDGRPVSANGRIAVANFAVPVKRLNTSLALSALRTDVNWRKDDAYWRLNLEDLWLGLSGPAWSAGHLRVVRSPDATTIRLEHIDLEDVGRFVTTVELESKLLDSLRAMRPRGKLHGVALRIKGDGKTADDYRLEAKIEGLQTEPFRKVPGVHGISGSLVAQGQSGTFKLDARDITVTAPTMFRAPLNANSVSAQLSWELEAKRLRVIGEDMQVLADDGRGRGTLDLRVPLDKPKQSYMNLQVAFSDGNGAHASRYFPIDRMPAKLISWLDRSIIAGHVTAGSLVIDGNLPDFPFHEGPGTFEVRAHVRDATFDYLPGWTPLTDAEGDILFRRSEMLITVQQGAIGELQVGEVVVTADDLRKQGKPIVEVNGMLEGPVDEALRVLRVAPAPEGESEWKSYVNMGIAATGHGVIKLELKIPGDDPDAFEMNGRYIVRDGTLNFRVPGLHADNVRGQVAFTRWGPTEGELRGGFLGGGALVKIRGRRRGLSSETLLSARGTLTKTGLFKASQWSLMRYLDGYGRWTATMRLRRGRDHLRLQADLRTMRSRLPPPLDRPQGIAEKLFLVSENAGRGQRRVSVRIGKHIDSRFQFAQRAGEWHFTRGAIVFGTGKAKLPRERGLDISAQAAHVDADPWFKVLGRNGRGLAPGYLRRLRGNFDSLYLFNRKFGKFEIEVLRNQGVWNGRLTGDAVHGRIRLVEGRSLPIDNMELELERLAILEKKPQPEDTKTDPRKLPTLQLTAKSLEYKGRALGAFDFAATHNVFGWRINRFSLVRPEVTVSLTGRWANTEGYQRTDLDLQLRSADMGTTLAAMGMEEQMHEGKADVSAKLAWRGSPADPDLSTLGGSVVLSCEDGRFLQIKPGAGGRFIGLLDFSAIGKFFTVDFGPLFGQGMHFKELKGDISLERGNAYTRNLYMRGVAQISFNGRVGLAEEDFDLAVQVVPSLGTNIGIWAILGPQAGILLLALEKAFKKKFAAGTRITYLVKGPWDDPTVERLGETLDIEELTQEGQ
ncbi:MAG: YhdP family protein [Acidiferrobacterales bacterium]